MEIENTNNRAPDGISECGNIKKYLNKQSSLKICAESESMIRF